MYITAKIIMSKLDRIYIQYMNDKYQVVYKILKNSKSLEINTNKFKVGMFIVCKTNKNKTIINEIISINDFGI